MKFVPHMFKVRSTFLSIDCRSHLCYISQKVPTEKSVADPDPGLGAFLTPGSGIRDGKKSASGSGIRDEQPWSETIFLLFGGLKYLNSLMRIRDGKKSDPGSGINIPDPQHWQKRNMLTDGYEKLLNFICVKILRIYSTIASKGCQLWENFRPVHTKSRSMKGRRPL